MINKPRIQDKFCTSVSFYNMSCCSKEKMERFDYNNTCKSQSVKSDREMYRVCPSKLSKRELEDLYFTLLENNLELKKTINGQQDKIRVMSTQLQRMTNNHDKIVSKEMKVCSTDTKAFVNEQKDFIAELKETNRRMAERIQQLNMRLCSAKQFVKTSPPQTSNYRRFRSATASPPKKHNCLTKDQDNEQVTKLSTSSQWEDRHNDITKDQDNEQVTKLSTSSQWEDRHNGITKDQDNEQVIKLSTSSQLEDSTPRKIIQIIEPLEKRSSKSDQPCDENKCRFLMEELKIKIVTLKDELFNVHEEYSTRISRLESEVSEVRKENIRVSSERSASEHELQNTIKRTSDILAQHRLSEAKCSELTAELAIEKRKVAELETQLKAANMSDKVNKTIKEHLTTIQETNGAPDDGLLKCNCGCPPPPHLPPAVMNEKAPIKTLPLVSPPKTRDLEDSSVKTKYDPSKVSSSTVTRSNSQLLFKSSPTKTVSEETNCETCGCKPQLTSDPVSVHSPAPDDELNCDTCGCKPELLAGLETPAVSDPVPMHSPAPGDELNCDTCGCKPELLAGLETPAVSDPVPIHSPAPGDETNPDTSDCKDQLMSDPAHRPASAEETNPDTSDCKDQLMSDPAHRPALAKNCKCCEYVCPPQDLCPQDKNTQCDLRGFENPKYMSTPRKAIKKSVQCDCPVWAKSGILKPAAQSQEEHAKCIKCCFKYEDGATNALPSKNGKVLSPRGATTPPSPRKEKDGTKPSKTGDDSGYQDSADELVLIKQNRELMTKILELQDQVDFMKIQMCEMSEAKPGKVSKSTGSPKKTRDHAAVASAPAPLLGEITKAKIPEEQIEYNKPIDGGNYKPTKQVPFSRMVSETRVREPGKILSIEILGNPKEPVRVRSGEATRAKTIEDADGTIKISEEPPSEGFTPLDLMNDDYERHSKTDSPTLKIKEKSKLEIPGSSKLDFLNMSLKSDTGDILVPGFNPEKLKYLEAEGIVAQAKFGEDMSKVKEDSSLIESVPSNPELGFGIPRFASKGSQNKPESDFGQAKKPPARGPRPQQARDDLMEVLQGKLNLPMTEALVANLPTAPTQTDETKKKKEDCENCLACSFDKECELKHENATKHNMNTLAPGMQKERAKKHDQHNSLQIPGPIPPLESYKKEKMRHLFSHIMKDKSYKQKEEGFIINPEISGQQTTATTDEPANLPDVSFLDNENLRTDSINIDKKILTQDKTDRSIKENKEDSYLNPKIYATDGPVRLPDVPFLDNSVDSNDDAEGKPSRIAFRVNNNVDPPLFEVKVPTNRSRCLSERMLPTLPSTNLRSKAMHVEGKADVIQSTDPKLAEESSQVPTNMAGLCHSESCRPREVSLYRRRSGTLCARAQPAAGEAGCSCAGQQDGYCTDKPRKTTIQALDKEEVKSPRDQRRALFTSNAGTYTLDSKLSSPDNTELEMSDLSDLPMEKEKKSTFKSRPSSPGEDKTTTFTSTHSYYSPPPSLLSEGELPSTICKRKYSKRDVVKPYLNPTLAHKLETPPSQQMEAALQAISDELRRCKSMLSHCPAEKSESATQTSSSPEAAPPIALRPGVATQGIGDTYAPMSIFTLHIGTVVLSDKAVISSRNKNLVLKWKFYDQAVTMARMHAGRVVVFDFSTEYDIKVTEDFLHYLKHGEMPIVICELEHEEEPFASCVLPLRDALLHTNTRADMSLALVAGPQMLKERAKTGEADTINMGDEVGVIDLWCLMRADANMLPGINLAISQPGIATKSMEKRNSRVMAQVLDDYNELELTMGSTTPATPLKPTGKNRTYGSMEYNRTSNTWSTARSGRGRLSNSKTISYDPSKYPPLRERTPPAPAARHDAAQEEQYQIKNPKSDLIINEVNPKIKSPRDVRHAVEGSNRLTDSRSGQNRSEDRFSQAQSSYGSLKSVLSRLQKRGSRFTQTHGGEQRSFIAKLRKANKNKAEQSKRVTIMPKYIDAGFESPGDASEEPPQNKNQKRTKPKLEITVLWLALNEECEAMLDSNVQRVYVAYTFLGRRGAELETPVSLPKPKHYVDKCYFNFKKVFELSDSDLLKLAHMARCRAGSPVIENEKDCIIFSVISEPADDPLGIESCVDIGYAYLYLGDLLAYSAGSPGYTEVMPMRAACGPDHVCGVLAVRMDGLDVVRRCLLLTPD